MPERTVRREDDGALTILTFDRPKVLNAMTSLMLTEVQRHIDEMEKAGKTRVAILTGAGETAFIAGADISEMRDMTPQGSVAFAQRGQRVCQTIEESPIVFLAAVNGYALGGGCEIALACDIRIASENARFGQPEVKLGLVPGFGATQRLPRIVGAGRALDMILTNRHIEAPTALTWGLVTEVHAPGQLMFRAREIARTILSHGPIAVSTAKMALRRYATLPLAEALHMEARLFSKPFLAGEAREGCAAFLEKRPPSFSARQTEAK